MREFNSVGAGCRYSVTQNSMYIFLVWFGMSSHHHVTTC